MVIKEIAHNSSEYIDALHLRTEVLRKPLGLVYDKNDLKNEYDSYHLASFIENEIVGYLILKPISESEVKMRQVAVKPTLQKQHIGKKLVQFAEDFARNKKFTIMTLHARNTAIPFYQKLEYSISGQEFLEVNIPHHKMFKNLI